MFPLVLELSILKPNHHDKTKLEAFIVIETLSIHPNQRFIRPYSFGFDDQKAHIRLYRWRGCFVSIGKHITLFLSSPRYFYAGCRL